MINERQYTRIIKKSEGLQIKNENLCERKQTQVEKKILAEKQVKREKLKR